MLGLSRGPGVVVGDGFLSYGCTGPDGRRHILKVTGLASRPGYIERKDSGLLRSVLAREGGGTVEDRTVSRSVGPDGQDRPRPILQGPPGGGEGGAKSQLASVVAKRKLAVWCVVCGVWCMVCDSGGRRR